MKLYSISFVLLFWFVCAQAQTAATTTQKGTTVPADTAYSVVERGANHRIWERTTYEQGPNGMVMPKVHRYTELASGMHYKDANGNWQESQELIESYSGGAVARHGQYQVIFANNLNSQGAIDMQTTDGKRLRSNILGLMYVDTATGDAVLIAGLKDSTGQMVSANQVLYTDAFDGVKADVRYTYRKGGFEQDVILRDQPPTPESYGLDSDSTVLEVVTEFLNPPAASVGDQNNVVDDTISWGATKIGKGKAFDLSGQKSLRSQVPVNKRYLDINGRHFLIEQVRVKNVEPQLNSLPLQSGVKKKLPAMASSNPVYPPAPLAQTDSRPMQMAVARQSMDKGYVLDYVTINSALTNFTFQGDMTYYISGDLNLYGTTTVEGGAVVKYTTGPTLSIHGSFNCATAPYRPAIFTSQNDNTVGESISGSTGTPTIDHSWNNYFLVFDSVNQVYLHDVRLLYCQCGITSMNGNIDLKDVQIIHSDYPVYLVNAQCSAFNALISDVQVVAFEQFVSTNAVSQLTLDRCAQLGMNDWDSSLRLTNSLLTGVASMGDIPYVTNQVACLSTNLNAFRAIGGGSYYLATNSPYRGCGTTNISPSLLAALRQKTTYPPLVYSNINFTTATNFSPQAPRDTNNAPDLGYHYDPLDYVFGGCVLSSNMTFTAGTAVGYFHSQGSAYTSGQPYGICMNNWGAIQFNGSASAPCHYTRYETVQETVSSSWPVAGWLGGIVFNGNSSVSQPSLTANFTVFSTVNVPAMIRDNWAYGVGYFSNSEFYNGHNELMRPSLYFTNCLFSRAGVYFNDQSANCAFIFQNCTFKEGALTSGRGRWVTATTNTVLRVNNTVFDGTSFVWYDSLNGNTNCTFYNYNSYNLANTNWQTYPYFGGPHYGTNEVVGPNDLFVTNGYNWQSSWLGDFYLPPDSPLIDKGSTNANLLALYHFTTQTNQTIEGSSIVDIGYHYVAVDARGNPLDTDGDGISDYLEDANGNGVFDTSDLSDWQLSPYNGLGSANKLQVFTPLK